MKHAPASEDGIALMSPSEHDAIGDAGGNQDWAESVDEALLEVSQDADEESETDSATIDQMLLE